MREREKRRKNIVIGGLLAVVVLMAVAYAAFASNLTITGTGTMSGNWCIGFDSTRTSDYEATAGITGGTTPTGSMSFSGDACASSFKTTASLNASFKQPGDKIEYTLTIGNKGSFAAAIESINVDNQSVTSDTTITKGNIKYIIEMPESTSLAVNATTTMKVTAMFQNDTPVGSSTTEQQTISIAINAVQDDGNGGFTPTPSTFTGTIYRNNTIGASIGDSIVSVSGTKWCANHPQYGNSCDFGMNWDTEQECETYVETNMSGQNATCEQKIGTFGGVGEYTTNASTLNKTYYLKHDVVDNIITASYVCFVTDTEHCMQGGDMDTSTGLSPSYSTNQSLLQSQQTWFNNHSGSCSFVSGGSHCSGGGFNGVNADSNGYVYAHVSVDDLCYVNDNGFSRCNVSS